MSGKPKLHYFNGRGRMESIRWLLAAAGVEFEECFLETKEDLTKLQKDGSLLFQQVPMVEIDGMKMVQSKAIANYIAAKYNLYGKDLKERALIDMYVEAIIDLNELLMTHAFQPEDKKQQHFANLVDKATNRYFPVFEKVLKDHGQDFLVGNQLSRADVQLLESLLMAEECKPDILAQFPLLQSFKTRISHIPTIKKFLQPGSQRKPPLQQKDLPKVMKIVWVQLSSPLNSEYAGTRGRTAPLLCRWTFKLRDCRFTDISFNKSVREPAYRPSLRPRRARAAAHGRSGILTQGLRPRHRREPHCRLGASEPFLPRQPCPSGAQPWHAADLEPGAVPRVGSQAFRTRPRQLFSPQALAALGDAVYRRKGSRETAPLPPRGPQASGEREGGREVRLRGGEGGPRGSAWAARSAGGAVRVQDLHLEFIRKKEVQVMAGKPKLHYSSMRGRMESIRWLLAAAGVEFEEQFIEKKEDLEKLRNDGYLLFQQVPMVEIDGMKVVQTRAICSYIAAKYNLYGKDLKERAWIDMYVEGTKDLLDMIMYHPFQPADTKEKNLALIIERATTRYFPVYEKALKDHGQDYLVGNKLSWADIHLLEAILTVEEWKPDILSAFPLLQAFKGRTSNIPTIKKFLQPGSQRQPPEDEKAVALALEIYGI
ncbi:uncharacterized protein PRD47_006052 [Ara ararauna]